jgi:acyl-coenzyme A thioesterase PaaI-like protein
MDRFTTDLQPDDPRIRLADATRRIIDELSSSTADDETYSAARDLVEQATAVLKARDHRRSYDSPAEASLTDFGDMSFVDYSPFFGVLNPLAPPIKMSVGGQTTDTEVVGHVVYGDAYEGPPGCVHGGFIAGGFDEVLGFTQARSGQPGMTAKLEINYRSPTPLHRELEFRGRIVHIDGRKIHTTAELTVAEDGRVCAEATALFVSMKPQVFERLMRERSGGAAGD